MSYQNTLLKPENPTQGHMTSHHKDVRCATKTSIYHKDEVPRYQCHKEHGIWLGNHWVITCLPKGKSIKGSKFIWNENIVHFQVVSQKSLKYPIYSQDSQVFQNYFLLIRFSINFHNITSQDKTSLEFANNALNPQNEFPRIL